MRLTEAETAHPDEETVIKQFREICKTLDIDGSRENMEKMVIYEMTDGLRTSTDLKGWERYFDGAMFSLRQMKILKSLGSTVMYTNIVEERHTMEREDFSDILEALMKCPPIWEKYAMENDVKLVFLGHYPKIEPTGKFGEEIDDLMEKTENNRTFTSIYLLNYSPEWAMENEELLKPLPNVNVTIRHTRMQVPPGMQLPPKKSDASDLVYVQTGSSSKNWSDRQLTCLSAISLRSRLLNWPPYRKPEAYKQAMAEIKRQREAELYILNKNLFEPEGDYLPKRAVITIPWGPEIYEF